MFLAVKYIPLFANMLELVLIIEWVNKKLCGARGNVIALHFDFDCKLEMMDLGGHVYFPQEF